MNLLPPTEGLEAYSRDILITLVQNHAISQGYAVTTRRSNNAKNGPHKGENNKVYLKCDRGDKIREGQGFGKRIHSSSRLTDCLFECVLLLDFATGIWRLKTVKDPNHNHKATLPGSHLVIRKLALTPAVQDLITRESRVGVKPTQILSALRLDKDEENPMFKRKDIYNAKSAIRAKALGSYTPIQALIIELYNQEVWFTRVKKFNISRRIQSLFFCRTTSQKILRLNPEVLIIDATYKTNRYRLPLVIITGVTALNTSFYVGMAFIDGESIPNYEWVLEQLRELYQKLNCAFPTVILTDHEQALINASSTVFPQAELLLCTWHIHTNIIKNCKKFFFFDTDWDEFFGDWLGVESSTTLEQFNTTWDAFQDKYSQSVAVEVVNYLYDRVIPFRSRFILY